jgi:serine/threonine-protein kinase TTK/MPS1
MATASPTPMPTYSSSSTRLQKGSRFVRRDSPLTRFEASQGHTTVNGAGGGGGVRIPDSDDTEEFQPPPMLSALGRSVLAEHGGPPSPKVAFKASRTRQASRNASPSNTPHRPTTTPAALSQRVKRIGLSGAPVRRGKRTPQSEEEHGGGHEETHAHHHDHHDHHHYEHEHEHEAENDRPPSQDQENLVSAYRTKVSSVQKVHVIPDSITKTHDQPRNLPVRDAADRALAPKSSNTPHRPAPPPPPPKMSVLEAATKAAGASTTKKKSRRANIVLNGKIFNLVERCGKGGSAEVWRVTAENGKPFALKKVRLQGQDPGAVAGYKGEIDLLAKLQDTPRVVRMYDYSIDLEKEVLYVVCCYTLFELF